MQIEITQAGSLLDENGKLAQIGWSRLPLLDCNLEQAAFYPRILHPVQFLRIKRWDYYAVFTPQRFFSATIADLGYAGNIFVYTLDFSTHAMHEEGLVIPLSKGIQLPRNSTEGQTYFEDKGVYLEFKVIPDARKLIVSWPKFDNGKGILADLTLHVPKSHESMNIVIPIKGKRFYYNCKTNCLPAEGTLRYGDVREDLLPDESSASLDWGRGVWEYSSFWNWASASGFLSDGRTVGLNLGCGFGDISAATENCLILAGRVHKLDQMKFDYDPQNYSKPWKFNDNEGRLSLDFIPFKERVARTNLGIINSEVHQMFGRYSGQVTADFGEVVQIDGLVGFAEEHQARW